MSWTPRQVEVASGLLAGFANTLVTQPLDLLKVRLQLSTESASQPFHLLRVELARIAADARQAQQKSGSPYAVSLLRQCYRGVGPNLVGNVSAWSLYFTLYAEFKSLMASADGTTNYFAASSLAGATSAVLTNPIWLLKTRILSTASGDANSYKSVKDGIAQIVKKEGVATFWKGTVPSLFHVLQASLQFTIYEHTKDYLGRKSGISGQNSDKQQDSLSPMQFIYASVVSKTASMAMLYPTQVVRSRIQSHNWDNERRTMVTVVKKVWSTEGLRGFYRGLSANVLRVLPSTCITFLTYETTKKHLKTVG